MNLQLCRRSPAVRYEIRSLHYSIHGNCVPLGCHCPVPLERTLAAALIAIHLNLRRTDRISQRFLKASLVDEWHVLKTAVCLPFVGSANDTPEMGGSTHSTYGYVNALLVRTECMTRGQDRCLVNTISLLLLSSSCPRVQQLSICDSARSSVLRLLAILLLFSAATVTRFVILQGRGGKPASQLNE